MPATASPPSIVDLAGYRAARHRAAAAKVLVTPSPVGFLFLNLPVQDCLPAFMAAGFSAKEAARDV